MSKPVLTSQDFIDAAAILNCSVAAIKAVAEVESSGGGFFQQESLRYYLNGISFPHVPAICMTAPIPVYPTPNLVVMAPFPFSTKDCRKQFRSTEMLL